MTDAKKLTPTKHISRDAIELLLSAAPDPRRPRDARLYVSIWKGVAGPNAAKDLMILGYCAFDGWLFNYWLTEAGVVARDLLICDREERDAGTSSAADPAADALANAERVRFEHSDTRALRIRADVEPWVLGGLVKSGFCLDTGILTLAGDDARDMLLRDREARDGRAPSNAGSFRIDINQRIGPKEMMAPPRSDATARSYQNDGANLMRDRILEIMRPMMKFEQSQMGKFEPNTVDRATAAARASLLHALITRIEELRPRSAAAGAAVFDPSSFDSVDTAHISGQPFHHRGMAWANIEGGWQSEDYVIKTRRRGGEDLFMLHLNGVVGSGRPFPRLIAAADAAADRKNNIIRK